MKLAAMLLPLLLITSACQKEVREVRRTDPDKYSVDSGGYAAKSGSRLDVQAGRSAPQTGRYSAGGITQGAPSAPSQRPAGVTGAPRSIGGS